MADSIQWGLATPKPIDFSWLGNLPDAYQQGVNQAQQNAVLAARKNPVLGTDGKLSAYAASVVIPSVTDPHGYAYDRRNNAEYEAEP